MQKKLKIISDLIGQMNFQKEDIKELVSNLLSLYQLSADEFVVQKAPSSIEPEEKIIDTGKTFVLEAIYEGNIRSKKEIAGKKAIGVIVPGTNLLLYREESGNPFSRRQERSYRSGLPGGYSWHLMNNGEAETIRNNLSKVNDALAQIGGDVIGNGNYMLADDNQDKGIVRYIAVL